MKYLNAGEQEEERKSFQKLGFKRNFKGGEKIQARGATNIELVGSRSIAKIIDKLNWI